jgi:IS605 OrfB family transposase
MMIRTVKIKLPNDSALISTIKLYNNACNITLAYGFKKQTYDKNKLHHGTYNKVRRRFKKLNSSYVCASRDQASDMLKREKNRRLPVKRNYSSIRLNHNTFTPFLESGRISISTIHGRKKFPITIPACYQTYMTWKITAATMAYVNNTVFIHLNADSGNTPVKRNIASLLGIDSGINNIIVTSDNRFFNSRHLRNIKSKCQFLRYQLQQKGTRSAKRKLKRMASRERRFVRDVNHCLSKYVAHSDADAFALEDLDVKKHKANGKRFNRMLGGWSYHQFQEFLTYKAEALGKTIVIIDPRYTSQRCSLCGNIDKQNRNGRQFLCKNCGFTIDADLNASRNIAFRGNAMLGRLPVNQPIVARDRHDIGVFERSYKPPFLNGGS